MKKKEILQYKIEFFFKIKQSNIIDYYELK